MIYIYEYVLYIFCFLIKKRHLFDKRSKGVYISFFFFQIATFLKKGVYSSLFLLTLQTGATETLVFLLGQELVLHLI